MTEPLRLRRDLTGVLPRAEWPAGVRPARFTEDLAPALHALMAASYQPGEGSVAPLDTWWPALSTDAEYDPELIFLAKAADGQLAGACHCWTSGFVKDLVVAPAFRQLGIGRALLLTAYTALQARGARQSDLKVLPGNIRAIRLYRRLGLFVP